MQDTVKFVINKYSLEHVKFHVIAKAEDKIHPHIDNNDLEALEERVEGLEGGSEGIPALHKDLEKAVLALQNNCLNNSKKVINNIFCEENITFISYRVNTIRKARVVTVVRSVTSEILMENMKAYMKKNVRDKYFQGVSRSDSRLLM